MWFNPGVDPDLWLCSTHSDQSNSQSHDCLCLVYLDWPKVFMMIIQIMNELRTFWNKYNKSFTIHNKKLSLKKYLLFEGLCIKLTWHHDNNHYTCRCRCFMFIHEIENILSFHNKQPAVWLALVSLKASYLMLIFLLQDKCQLTTATIVKNMGDIWSPQVKL